MGLIQALGSGQLETRYPSYHIERFLFLLAAIGNYLTRSHNSQTLPHTLRQKFYSRTISFGLNNFVYLSSTCFINRFLTSFILGINVFFYIYASYKPLEKLTNSSCRQS